MTKRNLLLVCLVAVFGLAATAPSLFAQGTSWRVSNNTNYFARSEGDAEGVGTMTLTSLGAGTIAATSVVAFTYNAPLAHYGTNYAYIVSVTGALGTCLTITPEEYTADFTDPVIPSSFPTGTVVNNGVILSWSCLTTVTTTDTISIASRVMPQGYPNSFDILGNVRANGTKTQPLTLSASYPQNLVVAELEGGEGSPYTAATTITFHHGLEYVLTCLGVETAPGTAFHDDFSLNIKENWPNALTSLSDEQAIEEDSTWPTNGSNILITLVGIPPGVTVTANPPYPCELLPSTAPDYCLLGNLTFGTPVAGTAVAGSTGTSTQWFWYPVVTTNVNSVESAYFGFDLSSTGPLKPNQMYGITAQVTLTDLYPEDGSSSQANGEMPYFTLPEDMPFPVVTFIDCRTTLLFPYVNSYNASGGTAFSHFGTGINVSNTTWDPFALPGPYPGKDGSGPWLYPDMAPGSAVPQSGSCTFYLYPSDESTTVVYTTPSISAGGSYAFDAGATAKFQGKTGYGIAVCNFQNAHGFAEIYDNYGIGDPTATLGYLADVLPDPAFYHRSPAGDALGETAVAPVYVDKFIEQLLLNPWATSGVGGLSTSSKRAAH